MEVYRETEKGFKIEWLNEFGKWEEAPANTFDFETTYESFSNLKKMYPNKKFRMLSKTEIWMEVRNELSWKELQS